MPSAGEIEPDMLGEDIAGAAPDESFENATPTELSRVEFASTAVAPERPSDEPLARTAPSLDEIVAKLPAETRRALDELLRARFTVVRRIRPGQLR